MKLFISLLIFASIFSISFGTFCYFSVATINFADTAQSLQHTNELGNNVDGPLTEALIAITDSRPADN